MRRMTSDDEGRQVAMFCGNASDDEMARRVADLAVDGDTVVLRKVFIQPSPDLHNVALLSKQEASRTSKVMGDLSETLLSEGCSEVGEDAWLASLDLILPGQSIRTDGGVSILKRPVVGKGLHDFWGMEVNKGETILSFRPNQLQALGPADCSELARRMRGASQAITQAKSDYAGTNFLWLAFDKMP